MIIPTVGRTLWFWPTGQPDGAHPWPAIVTFVLTERRVDLAVFTNKSVKFERSVPLVQDDDEQPAERFCEWMPFQKGVADRADLAALGLTRREPL